MKNTGRGIRKVLSVLFALVIVGSCFVCSASAEESKSTSLLVTMADSFNKAMVNATAHPTPEHPLTYSYSGNFYARDPYGRAVPFGSGIYVDLYLNKEAYEKGAEPVATVTTGTYESGKGDFKYTAIFSTDPPSTLYYVIEPKVDVIFTPASGTVYAQLDPQVNN